MRFEYKLEDVAAAQLLEAALWYEEQRIGLGNDLILCFEEGVETICRNPFFEIRYKDFRIYNTRRFPYQILYQVEGDIVIIVAFFHAKRNPKDWRKLLRRK